MAWPPKPKLLRGLVAAAGLASCLGLILTVAGLSLHRKTSGDVQTWEFAVIVTMPGMIMLRLKFGSK